MGTISGTVSISRTPEDVFTYLDDFTNRPKWQTELKSSKVLTDGPVGVGTEVEEVREMGRKEFVSRWRVTSHEPPRRSTFETYDGKMLKPSGVITVAAEGAGSRVTFEMNPNPMGMAKVMMVIIGRQIKRNIDTGLANLKRNLESS
jgi:uncharacterized membrane protein